MSDSGDQSGSDHERSDPESDSAPKEARDRMARRAFFTEGFRNLMKPFSEMMENRLDNFQRAFQQSQESFRSSVPSAPGYYPGAGPGFPRRLRPPGALAEELFSDRCARSGQCVSACPVQAIQVLESDDPRLSGTPFIDPQVQACVVCDDLACMKVCPTGALQFVPRHLIHIGLAEVRHDTCVRTDGEDCRICVDKCPLGEDAIHIPYPGGDVEVKTDGCVGCGICELYCPTEPRAIVVRQD